MRLTTAELQKSHAGAVGTCVTVHVWKRTSCLNCEVAAASCVIAAVVAGTAEPNLNFVSRTGCIDVNTSIF